MAVQGGDLDANLYKDQFDPNSKKGDLDMAGLGKSVDNRQEALRALKSRLEDWRPVALPVVQFLEWHRAWNPAVLVAVNTVFFLFIWYLDLSVLSTLSVVGLIVTFLDGMVPILSTTIFDAGGWSETQDREYDALCSRLLDAKQKSSDLCANLHRVKTNLPRFFSLGLCGVFIFLAIIFDRINNFVLMYMITSFILLLPGLFARNVHETIRHHGTQLYRKLRNKKQIKQN